MMDGIVGSATKTPDLEGIKKDQEWFGMDWKQQLASN